jgi:hypothetical protein
MRRQRSGSWLNAGFSGRCVSRFVRGALVPVSAYTYCWGSSAKAAAKLGLSHLRPFFRMDILYILTSW